MEKQHDRPPCEQDIQCYQREPHHLQYTSHSHCKYIILMAVCIVRNGV